MSLTNAAVKALIDRFDMNDAIDPDAWRIEQNGEKIRATNAYNIVDKHGIYDSYRPFAIEWTEGDTLLNFDLDFDGAEHDRSLSGLQAYISGLVIEAVLELELSSDFPSDLTFDDDDANES